MAGRGRLSSCRNPDGHANLRKVGMVKLPPHLLHQDDFRPCARLCTDYMCANCSTLTVAPINDPFQQLICPTCQNYCHSRLSVLVIPGNSSSSTPVAPVHCTVCSLSGVGGWRLHCERSRNPRHAFITAAECGHALRGMDGGICPFQR